VTGTIFSEHILSQNEMVGGTGEQQRSLQNIQRISKIKNLKNSPTVLDFGCGNGMFVKTMQDESINAFGYDPFNPSFAKMPSIKADIVTMIEVIEHTYQPYSEIDLIKDFLKVDGLLFVETSFSDWVDMNHDYLNPIIGHSTIFSHAGLDLLMKTKNMMPENHINNNIRIFRKVS
jgi:2-polyprenyl-3-methyl-5-hydroxy-6-metoxy-1,4-benzoquinol methylase